MEWMLPLLKMDPSTLYNKYIGETENFRKAMDTADRMSPVVLWIDEIEKVFASSDADGDGGVTTRVLGTFLSWLQDRTGDVFVVATANDVSKLPPELLRKGRFDELFFVDLPDHCSREKLFEIPPQKQTSHQQLLTKAPRRETDGFSGADIEQVIVSGLYTSFDLGCDLDDELLIQEIKMTRPLSQTMPERIEALRQWAFDRTVPAN